jgi:phage terminase large subunit-like protein
VYRDVSVLAGRRSGKSTRVCAPVAIYEACIAHHDIPKSERGVVLIVAPHERQARLTFNVIRSKLEQSRVLAKMITNIRAGQVESEIQLVNNIDILVAAANARHVRGSNIVAAFPEEGCFFRDSETGNYTLGEIINALRPGMLTLPDSKLIRVSSPWIKAGPMWEDYKFRGERPDTLSWKLPSWEMNPALPEKELAAERVRDEAYFLREFGCEFVEAANVLLPADLVDAAVMRGVPEFPPKPGVLTVCGLDPSSKGDDFAEAYAYTFEGRIYLAKARAWRAPGRGKYIDYNVVLPQVIATMKHYGAPKAYSDQVSAAAIDAELRKAGLQFEQSTSYGTKATGKFQTLRSKIISGQVVLPDQAELITQLKRLEEILAEGGRSTVEARQGKDDLAIACAMAVHFAALSGEPRQPWSEFLSIALATNHERGWTRIN